MKFDLPTAVATALAACSLSSAVRAEEPIRIGFISTFSGPQASLGQEQADGFKLALQKLGNKLGGRSVEVFYGDDQAKPDVARQLADRMIERDKVSIVTGINFSNVLLAVAKPVLDSGAFYVGTNAGPSIFAGKQCNPNFFSVSFQNDTTTEVMGTYMQNKGIGNVYLLAPNYPAGKDMLSGFKRNFKGKLAGEVYTTFGQLDYAAEIAQIRAAKPSAVFLFLPGGMGISFVKQYAQAGLKDEIPLFTGAAVIDQTVLPALGDEALGMTTAYFWSEFSELPESQAFARDFEATYNRIPAPMAASAYDTANLLDAALTKIGGQVEDSDAFRAALKAADFRSVRGNFSFNSNHFPIQDFYVSTVVRDNKGRLVNGPGELIAKSVADSYASKCEMR